MRDFARDDVSDDMSGFEDTVRRGLRASAELVVVPDGLSARTRRGGMRRRRRRRLLMAAPVAGVAAVLGMVAWLGPVPARTSLTPASPTGGAPVQMTPDLQRSLSALHDPGLRAGHNDPFTNSTPLSQWTTWVDCTRLSAHLSMPLPRFEALEGYRVLCGSQWEGDDVFAHPVPAASDPAGSGSAAAQAMRVEVLYLPPGVDERTATFADATAAGASWLLISYGGDLNKTEEPDKLADAVMDRPDAMALTLSNGRQAGVQIAETGSLIGWSADVAGHRYGFQLLQPRDPLAAVRVFSSGRGVPD